MTTVAFDLNGTLLDPAAIADPLGAERRDVELVMRAFDQTVEQAMAVTLAGLFPPFPDLLRSGLERELELAGRPADRLDQALDRAKAMPAFPDAADALDRLANAGARLAVVSNSACEAAEQNLAVAGLRDRFELVVGADEVKAYKPDRRIYEQLLRRLGEAPAAVWLVTCHWWDVLGARACGLRTGWVSRKEQRLLGAAGRPDTEGHDLLAVADRVAAQIHV